MEFPVFSRNGEILPMSEATIPLSNIEYAYGFGVYENLRVHDGRIAFENDHVDRLFHSADVIGLRHTLDKKTVSSWLQALVKEVGDGVYNLKMLLIGSRNPDGCPLIILPLSPLFPDRKLYRDGATAITFTHERMFPGAKTLNMFPSYYAYSQARAKGCYDCLFVNRQGHVTEGTRTNFFTIRGKTLYSPPDKDILEGVTRIHMLKVAKENSYTLETQDLPLTDIGSFDGAFLTSTSSKIMPLCRIDSIEWKEIPKELKALMKAFDEYLSKTAEKIV